MGLLSNGIKMQTRPVCADGWILSADERSCQKITTMSAETTGNNILVKHYTNAGRYGIWGTIFYKNNYYASNGTFSYVSGDTSTYINYYNSTQSINVNGMTYINMSNTLWNNVDHVATESRLNKCAIWSSTNSLYVGTLGFSRQFTIQEGKIYYIGFGSDNYTTVKIDGNILIQQDLVTLKTQFNTNDDLVAYGLWHVYPVYLTSGTHTITLMATNVDYGGVLGVEIYNATEGQLIACTTESQLDQYTIFSTKNIQDGEYFDIGNYYCTDSNYQLVYDPITLAYSCKKIETTGATYI